MKRKAQLVGFEDDLMEKLRDPQFASAYVMSAIVDNDIDFLPIAGDVAKAYGISKLADKTGINRRTLYKVGFGWSPKLGLPLPVGLRAYI